MANDSTFPPSLVCRHMIFVLAWETVSPNAEHAVTITVVILSNPSDDRDTIYHGLSHKMSIIQVISREPSHWTTRRMIGRSWDIPWVY